MMDEERLRSARRVSAFRLSGVSLAYALNWLMPYALPEALALQADLHVFAAYWVLAAAVFAAALRSDTVARLVGLDMPVVDMPMIFLLQCDTLRRNPESSAPALVGIGFYALLIIAAAFSLEIWKVVLAGVVGIVLEGLILGRAGASRDLIVSEAGVLGGVAAVCAYNTRRTLGLLRSVASEQLFLSPEIGRLLREGGVQGAMNQRRVELSAVFCDLRGFTAFSERTSSEQVMELLQSYYDAVGEVVAEMGGTVKDHAGDGILSIVGAPIAHRDHAERAVRMAVRIRDRGVEILAGWRNPGPELGLGVGVASGIVTVGAIAGATRLEYVAVGPAVNLAARLCERAISGQVLVDRRTLDLAREIDDNYRIELVECSALKGIGGDVAVYSVDRAS
jgi:class 3 adenylate cyclase